MRILKVMTENFVNLGSHWSRMGGQRFVRNKTRWFQCNEVAGKSVWQSQKRWCQVECDNRPHAQILQTLVAKTKVGKYSIWFDLLPFLTWFRETEIFSRTQRPEREENYRNPTPRGLRYETSDRGLSLMENYLKVYHCF